MVTLACLGAAGVDAGAADERREAARVAQLTALYVEHALPAVYRLRRLVFSRSTPLSPVRVQPASQSAAPELTSISSESAAVVALLTYPNSGTGVTQQMGEVFTGCACTVYGSEVRPRHWEEMGESSPVVISGDRFFAFPGRRSFAPQTSSPALATERPIDLRHRLLCKTHGKALKGPAVPAAIHRPYLAKTFSKPPQEGGAAHILAVLSTWRNPLDNVLANMHFKCRQNQGRANPALCRNRNRSRVAELFETDFAPANLCAYMRWHHSRYALHANLSTEVLDYADMYANPRKYARSIARVVGAGADGANGDWKVDEASSLVTPRVLAVVAGQHGGNHALPVYLEKYTKPQSMRAFADAIAWYLAQSGEFTAPHLIDCREDFASTFRAAFAARHN
jgi:hypothetical protein